MQNQFKKTVQMITQRKKLQFTELRRLIRGIGSTRLKVRDGAERYGVGSLTSFIISLVIIIFLFHPVSHMTGWEASSLFPTFHSIFETLCFIQTKFNTSLYIQLFCYQSEVVKIIYARECELNPQPSCFQSNVVHLPWK